MPFALVIIGLIMIVTGAKGTQSALGKQLVKDFTGPGNFLYWFFALGAVASLGAIPKMRGFSNAFMALILIVMIIRKDRGVFDKFREALDTGPIPPDVSGDLAHGVVSDRATKAADKLETPNSVSGFVGTDLYDSIADFQSRLTGIGAM